MSLAPGILSFEKVVLAVELVKQRLHRAVRALESAGISYAVAGGNAVAVWVSKVDPAAARNTVDVDLLVKREDLEKIRVALEGAGFVYRHAAGLDIFLDGPEGKPREAVHLVFAGEKVRESEPVANPQVGEAERGAEYWILSLEALVRIKLTAFRRKDQVHLSDMIEVGLLDGSWPGRFPKELGERLQMLLDTPNG